MPDGTNAADLILDDREDGIFRVHRSAFVDREIFEQERARIFDRSWLFAGHVSEFPKPGDFVTRTVAGRPVKYMISVALPRFCDQSLDRTRKERFYPGA